jgi:lysyl-tRNA synthetase class 2
MAGAVCQWCVVRGNMGNDWPPTASLAVLRLRAALLRTVREFFDAHGYWEVDTPLLSADIVVDAWLEPFVCHWLPDPAQWPNGGEPRFLQTSPEFAMKRLLAAGADAIYQLGKAFRNGETGRRHNPEFTLLEWYRLHDDHFAQMRLVEQLVRAVFAAAAAFDGPNSARRPRGRLAAHSFACLTYDEAFARHAGRPVLKATLSELRQLAAQHRLIPPPGLADDDRDGWLNWLLAELVEPHLGIDHPTFVWGYPASQAALAQTSRRPDGVEIAHRFELYIDGVELCNGYHELLDAEVLRQRIQEQAALRAAAGLRPLPATNRLLSAMEAGLPPCCGVALGFDRLLMLAVGARSIEEVIPFPFSRA